MDEATKQKLEDHIVSDNMRFDDIKDDIKEIKRSVHHLDTSVAAIDKKLAYAAGGLLVVIGVFEIILVLVK